MITYRRIVREKVMQSLYAKELGGGTTEQLLQQLLASEGGLEESGEKIIAFANALYLRLIDNDEQLTEIIIRHTNNWDVTRIALIDKILLKIAVTEFLFFEDIPPKVSINEAIDIAKQYSTNQSGKFINGVLDAILKELRDNNKLQKTGRGLKES
jgi:transcription antitermination protein NusB